MNKKMSKKPPYKSKTAKNKKVLQGINASGNVPQNKAAKDKHKNIIEKQDEYPHFRRYEKSLHPALIVGEQVSEQKHEEYKYRKVMHNKYDGDRLNEDIFPNPDPTDIEPMYIGKRVRHDKKKNFSKWKYPWKYPKK